MSEVVKVKVRRDKQKVVFLDEYFVDELWEAMIDQLSTKKLFGMCAKAMSERIQFDEEDEEDKRLALEEKRAQRAVAADVKEKEKEENPYRSVERRRLIGDLKLPTPINDELARYGMKYVGDLVKHSVHDIFQICGRRRAPVDTVLAALRKIGMELGMPMENTR